MQVNSWQVDLKTLSASHVSGLELTLLGDPLSPEGLEPRYMPDYLSANDQTMLVQMGLKAIRDAAAASCKPSAL